MTSLERWVVFFCYTPDKGRRELVNEIIKFEEGIARNALQKKISIEDIIDITGLTRDEVVGLRVTK